MIGADIQTWAPPLIGCGAAFAHQNVAPMLEMIHVLGNSYRLACSGLVSSVLYGRFATAFCRATFLVAAAGNSASRRPCQPLCSSRAANAAINPMERRS